MRYKICHVTSLHSWKDTRIYYKECISLSKVFDVTLVAPNTKDLVENGISVRGVNLPDINSRLKRFLQLKRIIPILVDIDADIYHFHDPELMRIGILMKKKGKTVIFDSHEDVPLQIMEKGWIPSWIRPSVSRMYAFYEKRYLKKYDAVVTVTPSIVERLNKINTNVYQITNYPIIKDFQDERKWGNSICFAGLVGPSWMHANIVESIKDLGVKYNVAGHMYPDGYFQQLIKDLPYKERITYVGRLPMEKVSSFIQSNSIGMALCDYVPNMGYKIGSLGNTKLFEYMMAGVPVIATDFDLWKDIVEKYNCGICVNPHDVEAIRNAIVTLLSNPEKLKEMGNNGRKAVEALYNWSTQEEVLLSMYKKILL